MMVAPGKTRLELTFPLTFIVRVGTGKGVLRGVVERVRSGAKQRFEGAAALAEVIAAMVEEERKATVEAAHAVNRVRTDR